MNRTKVIETLDKLPPDFSTEELIDRLLFIDKVEKGLEDANKGNVISLDEVKDQLAKKWQK